MECMEDFVQDLVRGVYGPEYRIAKKNGAARKSSFDERLGRINEIAETRSIDECCRELDRLSAEIAVEKDMLERRAREVLDTLKQEEELCRLAGYRVYERSAVQLTSERLKSPEERKGDNERSDNQACKEKAERNPWPRARQR